MARPLALLVVFCLACYSSYGFAENPTDLTIFERLPINASSTHIAILKKPAFRGPEVDDSFAQRAAPQSSMAYVCAIVGYKLIYAKCHVNNSSEYEKFISQISNGSITFSSIGCPVSVQNSMAKLQFIGMGKHDQWTSVHELNPFGGTAARYRVQIVNGGEYFEYRTSFFANNPEIEKLATSIEDYLASR